MRLVQLVILSILVVLSLAQNDGQTSILRDIILTDCQGGLHFFPDPTDTIAAANAIQFQKMYSYAYTSIIDRVRCVCPNAKEDDILSLIPGTVEYMFNMFSANPLTALPNCPDLADAEIFSSVNPDLPEVVLPSTTCDWKNDKECYFQMDVGFGIVIDVAVEDCPNSYFPLISFGCSGPTCERLMMPCIQDDECGDQLICEHIVNYGETDTPYNFPTISNLTDLMTNLLLAEGDCLDERGFWYKLINFIRDEVYDVTNPKFETQTFNPRFCLPNLNPETLAQEIINGTNLADCDLEFVEKVHCYWGEFTTDTIDDCPMAYECYYYPYDDGTCEPQQMECEEYAPDFSYCAVYACREYEYDLDGNRTCVNGRVSNELVKLDCYKGGSGPLLEWDGIKDDPELGNVHNWVTKHPFEIPKLGLEPWTTGAIPIFYNDCEGNGQLFPNTGFGIAASAQRFKRVYDWVYDLYRERFDCLVEENKPGDNDINFHIQQQYFTYLFLATSDLATYEEFQAFDNFETFATYSLSQEWNVTLPDGSASGAYFFEFPSTCNWETWTKKGECAMKFKGLSSLLGIDVEFNVQVEQCGKDFPSIYVECEGDDCDLLTGVVPCDPAVARQCLNAECQPIRDVLEEIYMSMQSEDPSDPNWTPQPLESDFIAEATGIMNGQCGQDTSKLEEDFTNVLRLLGFPETATHICSPDFERSDEMMEDWLATQWELVNERIHFVDLVDWSPPPKSFGLAFIPSLLISLLALLF